MIKVVYSIDQLPLKAAEGTIYLVIDRGAETATLYTSLQGNWIPAGGAEYTPPEILPIVNGGTGASTKEQARVNLEVPSLSDLDNFLVAEDLDHYLLIEDVGNYIGDGIQDTDLIDSSTGIADAGKPIKTDSLGLIDASLLPALSNITDHDQLDNTSLVWGNSGHTGPSLGIAGFDMGGATTTYSIGSDIQAYSSYLTDIHFLGIPADGSFLVSNGLAWIAESDSTARTSLGLGSLATASTINNSDWSGTSLSVANGGTGGTDQTTARSGLGLTIGADVQAYNANLQTLAGLSVANDNFIVGNGSTWTVESGATARASLGLGTMATQSSSSVNITGGTITGVPDLIVAGGLRIVRTLSDQLNIGIAFTDITDLSFSVAANTAYFFEFYVIADADAVSTGIDVAVNGPSSPTLINYTVRLFSSATAVIERGANAYDFAIPQTGSAGVSQRIYEVRGIFINGANAGNLVARIKKENVGVGGPNVRAGSVGRIWLVP